MKSQPKMIILVGLPACGKNTWITNIKNKNKLKSFTIIELDWIRSEIFGHQYHLPSEPFVIALAKTIGLMLCSQGKNVLINSTGITYAVRKDWITLANKCGYKTEIVWFQADLDTCLKRNSKRTFGRVPDATIFNMAEALKLNMPYGLEVNKITEVK